MQKVEGVVEENDRLSRHPRQRVPIRVMKQWLAGDQQLRVFFVAESIFVMNDDLEFVVDRPKLLVEKSIRTNAVGLRSDIRS